MEKIQELTFSTKTRYHKQESRNLCFSYHQAPWRNPYFLLLFFRKSCPTKWYYLKPILSSFFRKSSQSKWYITDRCSLPCDFEERFCTVHKRTSTRSAHHVSWPPSSCSLVRWAHDRSTTHRSEDNHKEYYRAVASVCFFISGLLKLSIIDITLSIVQSFYCNIRWTWE